MFTGLIEEIGSITSLVDSGDGAIVEIAAHTVLEDVSHGDSIAISGVCLTVIDYTSSSFRADVMKETLLHSAASAWKPGKRVNLERAARVGDRLGGHIVQGHVDQKGVVTKVEDEDGSWRFYFKYKDKSHLTVEKGSITVNGVSLTVVDSEPGIFSVAVIPYTYEHTNFKNLKPGDEVNLEFDVIGKYVGAYLKQQAPS